VGGLGQVATYVFDAQQLVLKLVADGGNMLFSPMPPAALTGVTWRVTGYNNGRADRHHPPGLRLGRGEHPGASVPGCRERVEQLRVGG
jgi:hypothetical protein